jgi:hypothetical protein
MDIADSCQVFLHDDVLDARAVGATLAHGALATCGCAVAAMLFNRGLISASTARRLRNASVLYSYGARIAAPLVVELVGALTGPALHFLQATPVPHGLIAGFVVVNLVFNQIYVFDDVKYVPVALRPSMALLVQGHAKFYSIDKRPSVVAFKRVTQAMQKVLARASKPKAVHEVAAATQVVVSKEELKDDQLTVPVCMALMFVAGCSYAYAREASRRAMHQSQKVPFAQLRSPGAAPLRLPKEIPLRVYPGLTQLQPNTQLQLFFNSAHVNVNPALLYKLSPRVRWAITATTLIALIKYAQKSAPHEGWLQRTDVDEE